VLNDKRVSILVYLYNRLNPKHLTPKLQNTGNVSTISFDFRTALITENKMYSEHSAYSYHMQRFSYNTVHVEEPA
jgi:hypothetical protein